MFQMVNNGVHWDSDYPLGIAMGCVIGNQAAKLGKLDTSEEGENTAWTFYPTPSGLVASRFF